MLGSHSLDFGSSPNVFVLHYSFTPLTPEVILFRTESRGETSVKYCALGQFTFYHDGECSELEKPGHF